MPSWEGLLACGETWRLHTGLRCVLVNETFAMPMANFHQHRAAPLGVWKMGLGAPPPPPARKTYAKIIGSYAACGVDRDHQWQAAIRPVVWTCTREVSSTPWGIEQGWVFSNPPPPISASS